MTRRSLLASRAGMILDWPEVDKAMLLAATPVPLLLGAIGRVRYILAHDDDEPYLSRPTLRTILDAIGVYALVVVLLALVWRLVRRSRPESPGFVRSCLFLFFFTNAAAAFLVGHFSTPILGAEVGSAISVLLLFDSRVAKPAVLIGTLGFFLPVVPIALGLWPYAPLYHSTPFVGGDPPLRWLLTSAGFGVAIAAAPVAMLGVVLERWRAHDAELHRLARLDGLTEIPNRRYFLERLAVEQVRAERHGSQVSLLLLDLDHFKRVNDRHGHPAGDQVLVEVARLLSGELFRRIDLVGRYGGEEFAVLLPETDAEGAAIVAERVRLAIEAMRIQHRDLELRITASVGVATHPTPEDAGDLDALVRRADAALYRAKETGRNRVSALPAAS